MLEGGAYTLASGTLYAIGGTYVGGYANFNHNGGTNYGDITLTNYAATYSIFNRIGQRQSPYGRQSL